ncbi:MAG: STAS domain-containing protein [Gemmatimonadota bacterium]|nr:MAG: STAS domain-containing protein [Gemmatimonadota bacterium]
MTGFEVTQKMNQDIAVLYLKGFLDAHTAPDLEKAFKDLIEEHKYNILVNFFDLDYISSAGLGVFMGFIEKIRENNGDIRMSNMTPKVFKIFDLLGFPKLYRIFKNEQEALTSFTE